MIKYTNALPTKEDLFDFFQDLNLNSQLKLSAQELLFAMKGSYFGVYVYDNDKFVGMGRVISDGVTYAYMCDIAVAPNYQHHGIGREIINKISAFCNEHSLHLQFMCDDSLTDFYKSLGFSNLGTAMKR